MTSDAAGGPRWRIDPQTSLPEITDLEEFLAAVARGAEATDFFDRATDLRRASGADAGSIASSALALARARRLTGQ